MPKRVPLARILILLFALWQLAGCGQMRPAGERKDLITYTVKPGDTLYSISWRYGYDHREVAAWNNIPPPYTIYVGQRLVIIPPYQMTAREGRPQQNAPSTARREPPPRESSPRQPGKVSRANVRPRPPVHVQNNSPKKTIENPPRRHHQEKIGWQWPTAGTIRNVYDPSSGKKGLDIEGKMGQPVYATASGKVVYSGDGLIGYGNLIIIKHDNTYLSAYGHNRRLLVKEGNLVKQGQKIAEMGDSGKQGTILHFEIRRDGKPVDPLRYLPNRGS